MKKQKKEVTPLYQLQIIKKRKKAKDLFSTYTLYNPNIYKFAF
jgi:hypothetical protein